MKLHIKYFGLIKEITKRDEESVDVSGMIEVNDILDVLYKKYPLLETIDFQVAQDRQIVEKNNILWGNEIVLLPPFSGG